MIVATSALIAMPLYAQEVEVTPRRLPAMPPFALRRRFVLSESPGEVRTRTGAERRRSPSSPRRTD